MLCFLSKNLNKTNCINMFTTVRYLSTFYLKLFYLIGKLLKSPYKVYSINCKDLYSKQSKIALCLLVFYLFVLFLFLFPSYYYFIIICNNSLFFLAIFYQQNIDHVSLRFCLISMCI